MNHSLSPLLVEIYRRERELKKFCLKKLLKRIERVML